MALIALSLFSSIILQAGFLHDHSLYWDTAKHFTIFRDSLHSLNRFGEIAWWFPQNQNGIPSSYFLVLNANSACSPVMVVWGLWAWILGRLGIFIAEYQPLYVIHYGFVLPLLFLVSLRFFLREIIESKVVRAWTLVCAAFSPAILFSTSDIGFLEPLTESLFFATTWLRFRNDPSRSRGWWLLTSTICLILGINTTVLYWNALFIPFFVILTSVMPYPTAWRKTQALWKSYRRYLPFPLIALALCFSHFVITFMTGTDIINPALGGRRTYEFKNLLAGNPLEALAVSLPGLGFEWDTAVHFALNPFSASTHTAYYYLGLPAFALFIVGALRGRYRHFVLISAFFFLLVVPLSAYSPLLAPIMLLETPLRACNHFSDVTFKAGGFLVLLIGAALGLERCLVDKKSFFLFRRLFLGWVLFCAAVLIAILGKKWSTNSLFGFFVVATLMYGLLLTLLSRARDAERKTLGLILFALFFLDVSTHAYIHMRLAQQTTQKLDSGWLANAVIDETPAESGLGIAEGRSFHYYANRFLMLRSYYEAIKNQIPVQRLPQAGILKRQDLLNASVDQVIAGVMPAPVYIVSRTYNDWEFEIDSPKEGTFFLRNAYSPYWEATVNGKSAAISRAVKHFESIDVPAGRSHISLHFHFPWMGLALLMSYAILLISLFSSIRATQRVAF